MLSLALIPLLVFCRIPGPKGGPKGGAGAKTDPNPSLPMHAPVEDLIINVQSVADTGLMEPYLELVQNNASFYTVATGNKPPLIKFAPSKGSVNSLMLLNSLKVGADNCGALCPAGQTYDETFDTCMGKENNCPAPGKLSPKSGRCKGYTQSTGCPVTSCENNCCAPRKWDSKKKECKALSGKSAKSAKGAKKRRALNDDDELESRALAHTVQPFAERKSSVTDEWHIFSSTNLNGYSTMRFGDWLSNGGYSSNILSMSSFYFTPPSTAKYCSLYMMAEWNLKSGSDWFYSGFNDINGPRTSLTAYNHYKYNPFDFKSPLLNTDDETMFYNSAIFDANSTYFAPDGYVELAYGVSGRGSTANVLHFAIETGGTVQSYLSVTTGPKFGRRGVSVSGFWVTCTDSPISF